MTIRTKFAVGLISILIVNLGAGLYALYLYQQASIRGGEVHEESSRIVTTALSTQLHFKKQVQEWKNVLLRGEKPGLYDRYFTQFEHEEADTRESVSRLIELLEQNEQARTTAERFLEAHHLLGDQYRNALRFYNIEDEFPNLKVDRRVRGIDRRPTDLIDDVVTAAVAHKARVLSDIDASIGRLERDIFLLMVGVMSGAVMLLIVLVDRTIGRPIATATAIAKRVSAGDFSTPIRVTGTDENAQMLVALKTMQENLAHSQQSLLRSEEHSHLLLESTGEGIYGLDMDARCIFCNPAAVRMLGYGSPAEIEGQVMHELMHHSYPSGSPCPLTECRALRNIEDGQPVHVDDEVFWRADGSSFPVEYNASPIYRDGNQVGTVVNFSDITARRRAEAELHIAHDALAQERAHLAERVRERTAELDRANDELARTARAKDEFLAAMSHELRTPLTSILGLSETMEDGILGELTRQQAKAAHTINENGAHLLELINDILDMSRVASGRMNLSWDQVPVNQIRDVCLRLISPSARAKKLAMTVNLDSAVRLIQGDSRRLKQMLINLLGNAVKFTPVGGTIGLDVEGDTHKGIVRISVWDTGVGIPQDQLDRLFKPFVQVDSRLSRQYGGTGLGLALAYGMAELHNGTIEVQSEVGQGSRFEIILPWNPEAQHPDRMEENNEMAAEVDLDTPPLERPQVLLVEDNLDNLDMVSNYLRIRGCEVRTACNGLEAISLVEDQPPDVILMDVQMPGMDGLEATRRLRTNPAQRVTPIIALTALAMPGDRERCLDAGMDDYLSKPLGLGELHKTLVSWVKKARSE